jgi:excisionase family DNA binding protein
MATGASDVDSNEFANAVAAHVAERLRDVGRGGTLFTLAEAAAHARCSTRTLHRALHSGRLRGNQPGGRGGKVLIAAEALDDWLFGRGSPREAAPTVAVNPRRRRVEPLSTPARISLDEIRPRRSP